MIDVNRIGTELGGQAGQPLTIVHVSDLHFGPSHRFEHLTTAGGDRVADGQTLLESLKADLVSVLSEETPESSAPIIIAVTGDLTDTAAPEQFREASILILGLEAFLKDRDARAIVVPGNHDVQWAEPNRDNRLIAWRAFARDRLQRKAVGLLEHPFAQVYDEYAASHGTIVAAINSAGFVERGKPDENRGRISSEGIADLDRQLASLPAEDTSLRIALVHHHPILIPDLVEAGRGYDAIVDGGDLLKVLRRHGFHLILHGHKHLPFNFSEDSRAAYSTRQPREQRPIFVVCGGSVGSSEVSDRMATPTNYYNIIRIKWLPMSGECRSRVEPRQLVRYDSGTLLPRGEWHWESGLADDRCFEPPSAERDDVPHHGRMVPFANSGIDDSPRISTYERNRGAFPVMEIRPSLLPSQAHEAHVWIEHHAAEMVTPDKRLVKVVWSAGERHEVTSVSDDQSDGFAAIFTYYGPMLVMAELTFADGHQSTEYIYVPMRRVAP